MTQLFENPLAGEELMDARTFSDLHARMARRAERRTESPPPATRPAPPRTPRPARIAAPSPGSPAAAAALEAEIDRSRSSETVARLTVYLARRYASATALLRVHRDVIQGLSANGLPVRPDTLMFPAAPTSVFGEVASSGRPFRGAPRAEGLDARILRALGREHVQEIAVLPVRVGGRVVSLLYADNGPEVLGDASIAALTSVCTRVASAYERLIRERRHSAPV